MKLWRGYLVAAIVGALTWALNEFAKTHTMLVDILWPYITRTYQTYLSEWSSGVGFCIWQVLLVVMVVVAVATLILVIVLKHNPIRWLGWVLAGASVILLLHTAIYGLNAHAGSIAPDIHMTESEYTLAELEEATAYYRDKANELAVKVERNAAGDVVFEDFDQLAAKAYDGFHTMVYDRSFSIFAGAKEPVKKLGWADMFSSMGITGMTVGITGEAAVNPQIPATSLPFTMCHEMAHRMSIATERDANFAAFLACRFNPTVEYQYSAYFMAYQYCYNALVAVGGTEARDIASRIKAGEGELLRYDLVHYSQFFASKKNEQATKVADTVNDTYLKTSGDEAGILSYGQVSDYLVNWHIQEIVAPTQEDTQQKFDPFDEVQVDLNGEYSSSTEETQGEEE